MRFVIFTIAISVLDKTNRAAIDMLNTVAQASIDLFYRGHGLSQSLLRLSVSIIRPSAQAAISKATHEVHSFGAGNCLVVDHTLSIRAPELLEELVILQLLLVELFTALLAYDEALGGIEDFLLDNRGCLPTLHPLGLVLKLGGFGPHAVYVFEVVLETINHVLLHRILLFLEGLEGLFLLQVSHVVHLLDDLLLLRLKLLSLNQVLSHAIELIHILTREYIFALLALLFLSFKHA